MQNRGGLWLIWAAIYIHDIYVNNVIEIEIKGIIVKSEFKVSRESSIILKNSAGFYEFLDKVVAGIIALFL